jgi:hypothetical protein
VHLPIAAAPCGEVRQGVVTPKEEILMPTSIKNNRKQQNNCILVVILDIYDEAHLRCQVS